MSHVKIVYDADKGMLVPGEGDQAGPAVPGHLCYIDDSRTSAYVTGKMLKKCGYEVTHFSDAELALDSILVQDYDLVITDLYVTDEGGVNGDDLVHLLRNSGHPVKSKLPIIVVTGTDDTAVHNQVLDAGANLVLIKPLAGDTLDAVIQQLLQEGDIPERIIYPDDYEPEVVEASESVPSGPAPFAQANEPAAAAGSTGTEPPLSTEETLRALKALGARPVEQTHNDLFSFASMETENTDLPGSPLPPVTDETPDEQAPEEQTEAQPTFEDDVPTLTSAVARKRETDKGAGRRKSARRSPEKGQKPVRSESENNLPLTKGEGTETRIPDADTSTSSSGFDTDGISMEHIHQDHSRSLRFSLADEVADEQTNVEAESATEIEGTAQGISGEPGKTDDAGRIADEHSELDPQAKRAHNELMDLLDKLDLDNDDSTAQPVSTPVKKERPQKDWHFNRVMSSAFVMVTLLVAAGIWLAMNHSTRVELVEVVRGDIHDAITVQGKVVSNKASNVTSYFPGQLISVKVKEGDRVSKNDILATMDGRAIKSEVKRAQANLMGVKEEVALTSKTLERLQKALDMGAVPRQMVEDAEANWKSASARQDVAQEELSSAKLRQARLSIRAPFEGIVTSLHAQAGQWLSPPEPLLRLVNLSKREIELKVDALDVSRLKVGQKVILTLAGNDTRSWEEKIVRIASTADNKDNSNTISVYVSIGSAAGNLIIGQQVGAEIRLASRSNTLKVPFTALSVQDDKPYVAMILNGMIHYIPVTTGIEDVSHIEIVSGLEPKQKIVKLEGLELEEGDVVSVD